MMARRTPFMKVASTPFTSNCTEFPFSASFLTSMFTRSKASLLAPVLLFLPATIMRQRRHVLNGPDPQPVPRQRADGGLGSRARRLGLDAALAPHPHLDIRYVLFRALPRHYLRDLHGRVRRSLLVLGLHDDAARALGDGLRTRYVRKQNNGVVVRCKNVDYAGLSHHCSPSAFSGAFPASASASCSLTRASRAFKNPAPLSPAATASPPPAPPAPPPPRPAAASNSAFKLPFFSGFGGSSSGGSP